MPEVPLPVDGAVDDRLVPTTDPRDVADGLGVSIFMHGILAREGLEVVIDNSVHTIDDLDVSWQLRFLSAALTVLI